MVTLSDTKNKRRIQVNWKIIYQITLLNDNGLVSQGTLGTMGDCGRIEETGIPQDTEVMLLGTAVDSFSETPNSLTGVLERLARKTA